MSSTSTSSNKKVVKPTTKTTEHTKTVSKPTTKTVSKPTTKTVSKPATKTVSKPSTTSKVTPDPKNNTSKQYIEEKKKFDILNKENEKLKRKIKKCKHINKKISMELEMNNNIGDLEDINLENNEDSYYNKASGMSTTKKIMIFVFLFLIFIIIVAVLFGVFSGSDNSNDDDNDFVDNNNNDGDNLTQRFGVQYVN